MRLKTATTGQGPNLVLLHGWGMNSEVWHAWLPVLEKHYTVTRVDLPGHGRSEYAPGMDSMASWVSVLLDVVPEQAIYIGWSLGGQLALQCALTQPECVTRLVMLAATPKFVTSDDWQYATDAMVFKAFCQALQKTPERTLERFLALQMRDSEHQKLTLKKMKSLMAAMPVPDYHALEDGLNFLVSNDFRQRLSDLLIDTLWMYGENDVLLPTGIGSATGKLMPNAEYVGIKGAGHALMLSHPETSAAKLLEFLNE